MKKRIRKILLLLVCIIISFFVVKVDGEEVPVGSNIGGHIVGEYKSCGTTSPFCFNYVPIAGSGVSGEYVQGIRITVVNQDGVKISGTHSHDFFLDKQRTDDFLRKNGVSFYSTKRHKNEIVNPESPNIPWTSNINLNYGSAGNYTILTDDPFPEYMAVVVENNRVLLKEYFVDRGQRKLWDFFVPTYLEPLGYDLQADIEANKSDPNFYKKRAILIEPLVWMRLTMAEGRPQNYAVDFAGTVTEVAKIMSQSKEPTYSGSETFWDLIRLYDDNGNLARYDKKHFSCETPFYRTYPLSIYCDTNEIIGGLQGVKDWVDGSYPGVYEYNFKNNEKHVIPNFAGEILTSNGVGAGHVWFNEIISLDCNDLEFAKNNVPLCCKELYGIHHGKGINIKNYLSPTGVSCCDSLIGIIPNQLYNEKCIIKPDACDYKFDVLCPGNCFSNTKGYVKDIGENRNENDWKCIFDSKNSLYPEVRSHYQWTDGGLLDNPYCEVYCREEIAYKLPGHGFVVKAGHHFTVGFLSEEQSINSWGPIEFSGFQECRTKGNDDTMIINHEQFVKDYEEADKKTLEKWKDWQYAIAWNGSVDNAPSSSYSCSCPNGKNPDGSIKYKTCYTTEYDPIEYCFGGKNKKNYCQEATSWISGCCCATTKPSKDEDYYEDEYLKAYNERAGYLEKIEKCNEWIRGYGTFEPNIQIQYEEDKYGFKFGEIKNGMSISWLKANLVKNKQNFLFYEGSKYDKKSSYSYSKTELITTHICEKPNGDYNTGEFCVDEPKEYPINDNREEIDKKKYEYTLADNVYRYVSKPRGESLLKRPINNIQYIDMGFPNLPIHYSRLPSILTKKDFYLDLRLLSFGLRNKFNDYIFKPKRFAGRRYQCDPTTTGYFDYKCNYAVDNEFMYCSETKCREIQVVFRQVSLSHPFITADGNERSPGENWHNDVEKITENRNLSVPERIYSDRDPMYEIILNTETIAQIKNYNRDTRDGYSDFNLECIVGEGRECTSNFIREEFSSSFVSRWCGMSSDWNQCEKDDNEK